MNVSKKINLTNLLSNAQSLLANETDLISGLANVAAVINACLTHINWCGFYLLKNKKLILGPFQGLPACNRIDIGKGVCGTAVKIKKTLVVPDVHKFPGHIACDTHSNSEIVMPLFHNKRVFGVLDIDSPKRNRFHKLEIDILNEVVNLINQFIQRIN